jgi:hypothetical protein
MQALEEGLDKISIIDKENNAVNILTDLDPETK